jgi:hypothetical protein
MRLVPERLEKLANMTRRLTTPVPTWRDTLQLAA